MLSELKHQSVEEIGSLKVARPLGRQQSRLFLPLAKGHQG